VAGNKDDLRARAFLARRLGGEEWRAQPRQYTLLELVYPGVVQVPPVVARRSLKAHGGRRGGARVARLRDWARTGHVLGSFEGPERGGTRLAPGRELTQAVWRRGAQGLDIECGHIHGGNFEARGKQSLAPPGWKATKGGTAGACCVKQAAVERDNAPRAVRLTGDG